MNKNNKVYINALVPYNDSDILENVILKVLELENMFGKEISLTLSDEAFIQELNAKYRKIDAPTDVLSFILVNSIS